MKSNSNKTKTKNSLVGVVGRWHEFQTALLQVDVVFDRKRLLHLWNFLGQHGLVGHKAHVGPAAAQVHGLQLRRRVLRAVGVDRLERLAVQAAGRVRMRSFAMHAARVSHAFCSMRRAVATMVTMTAIA